MILRERQKEFVSKCVGKLIERKNTLGIAPTGAGKTVCMAGIAQELKPRLKGPVLVLQHRDELVDQNMKTFMRFMGGKIDPRIINPTNKTFDARKGGFNFAMVQTLSRPETLAKMPPLAALFVDEAHHAAAPSYLRLIHRAKEQNPDILIFGTTATPNRGDNKALVGVFDNCADQINISELIRDGHLVRPRCLVVDVGTQEGLGNVKRKAQDFDMDEVARIMNTKRVNQDVVRHWSERAGNRKTVVFCANIEHAEGVLVEFLANGFKAGIIHGNLTKAQRKEVLRQYDDDEIQVLINVSVLTEGWDHQPTSCVVLLRPSSWKSTMMQMIGRGLRKIDPDKYPDIIKDDCIVLDFGTSILTHGDLLEEPDLVGGGIMECQVCEAELPKQTIFCPICGHQVREPGEAPKPGNGQDDEDDSAELQDFVMTEIDVLQDSPFRYESFYSGKVQFCTAFTAWACVVAYTNGRFYAVGGMTQDGVKTTKMLCNSSEYIMALQSADDWMREYGDKKTAKKSKRWITEAPTEKQISLIERMRKGVPLTFGERMQLTKYRAACQIEWLFNLKNIGGRVKKAANQ